MTPRWIQPAGGRAALLLVPLLFLCALASPVQASWVSTGYAVLRLFDRGDITHHAITAWIDPAQGTARFEDDVTFAIRGRTDALFVLLGADAVVDAVVDPETGQALRFAPTLRLERVPFTLYRINLPATEGGRRRLTFRWHFTRAQSVHFNPFIGTRYFYAGYPSLWHPHTPAEDFFTAELTLHVPEGHRAFADGEELEGDADAGVFRFRTEAPTDRLGVGAGLFQVEAYPLVLGGRAGEGADGGGSGRGRLEVWRPAGTAARSSSILDEVAFHVEETLRFLSERLGPLPVRTHRVVEMPFFVPASYPSASTLVYGGGIEAMGLGAMGGPAVLAAHETAHKWLGGLAGVPPVGNAWFAEGLTEYLAHLALASYMPEEWAREVFRERVYAPFVAAHQQGRPRAVAAIEVFDADAQYLYQKGTLLFRMLHRRLGDDAFYAAVRAFLEQYRERHGGARDFEAIVLRQVPEAARGELEQFFRDVARGRSRLDNALEVQGPVPDAGGHALTLIVRPRAELVEPGPVEAAVILADGSAHRVALEPGRPARFTFPDVPVAAALDPDLWLADVDPHNNLWENPKR